MMQKNFNWLKRKLDFFRTKLLIEFGLNEKEKNREKITLILRSERDGNEIVQIVK